MTWPHEQLTLPETLQNLITQGRCVVFVGSGISAGCYPSWPDLVNELCERCGSSERVSQESIADHLLLAAEDAKRLDESAYYTAIGDLFGRPPMLTSLLYQPLIDLPFASYLTTNFDPLLAIAGQRAHDGRRPVVFAYPSLDRVHIRTRSIQYLHGIVEEGKVPRPNSIVLSHSEFSVAYADNSPILNLLIPTFENDPICFIGCRLKEPPMKRVFDVCRDHQDRRIALLRNDGVALPSRYLILDRPEVFIEGRFDETQSQLMLESQQEEYLSLGIEVVWYNAPDDDHWALHDAFSTLADYSQAIVDHGWGNGDRS